MLSSLLQVTPSIVLSKHSPSYLIYKHDIDETLKDTTIWFNLVEVYKVSSKVFVQHYIDD